jgi:amino-acid N-acetyltransferase
MESALIALPAPAFAEVKEQLEQAGLPFDDVDEPGRFFYRVEIDGAPVGWGGLEPYGAEALLRSVVVPKPHQGRAHGRLLVSALADQARRAGVERLWLLTTTAPDFFAKLGFRKTDREAAPEKIRSSAEFASLCPASATCMMLTLETPEGAP